MEGTRRADVKPGIAVMVELTEDKRTGRLTGGKVKKFLLPPQSSPWDKSYAGEWSRWKN